MNQNVTLTSPLLHMDVAALICLIFSFDDELAADMGRVQLAIKINGSFSGWIECHSSLLTAADDHVFSEAWQIKPMGIFECIDQFDFNRLTSLDFDFCWDPSFFAVD